MAELKRLEARLTKGQMAELDNIARATGLNRTDVLRLLIANAYVDAEGMREGATVVLDAATMAGLEFFTMLFVKHGDNRPQVAKNLIEHFDVED